MELLELQASHLLVVVQPAQAIGAVCCRISRRRRPLEDAILK
jgi:hypothetical protein